MANFHFPGLCRRARQSTRRRLRAVREGDRAIHRGVPQEVPVRHRVQAGVGAERAGRRPRGGGRRPAAAQRDRRQQLSTPRATPSSKTV